MDELRPQRSGFLGWTLGTLAVAGVSFTLGFGLAGSKAGAETLTWAVASTAQADVRGVGSQPPEDIKVSADFAQFWDLWRQLKERYYKQPLDEKKMFYGAMSGMTAALGDPYTTFFEPKSAEEFNQSLSGKFEGIGAEIGLKEGQLQIVAPLTDMPAERAGLRAGDLIFKINATDTKDMSVEQAVSFIRGKKGTPVSLYIGRVTHAKDKTGTQKNDLIEKEYTIIRDTIVVKSVRLKWPAERIAHIEVTNFNQDTGDLFQQIVAEVMAKDPKGVILDLRNNPGGYLDRSLMVAGEWVGSNIVVMERRQGKIVERLPGVGLARLKDVPTIALVNQGSASASEIVAGALRDHGKAKLVGMKTFGKGSVQDYAEFNDKSAVKITIAEWLTPKEQSIDKQGIEPDVKVDRTQDDYNANKDPQLDKALELLGAKPVANRAAKQPPTKKPAPVRAVPKK